MLTQLPQSAWPRRLRDLALLAAQAVAVAVLGLVPLLPPLLSGDDLPVRLWPGYALVLVALVAVYFTNRWVAVPRLLFRGRGRAYAGVLLALLASVLLLYGAIGPEAGGVRRARPRSDGTRPRLDPPGPGFPVVLMAVAVAALGGSTTIASLRRSRAETERRHRAEQEQTRAELALLRAQLNPHLFFNTLNSIYALTELDVVRARQALAQLSRLMRHVLYQAQQPVVPLRQEVAFLRDYVALMALRLTPNVRLDMALPDSADDAPIPPLLLLPLLENAFKYGVSTTRPSTIVIQLTQDGATLALYVRNTIYPQTAAADATDEGSGIGLTNIRRRLELLYPDDRHHLAAGPDPANPAEFVVSLRLRL